MWKKIKFRRGIISLLLVFGLVMTNLSPLGAWATETFNEIVAEEQGEGANVSQAAIVAENTGFTPELLKQALDSRNPKNVDHLFTKEKIAKKVVQNGKVLEDNSKIDTLKPVNVTLNFDVPVIGNFKNKVPDITQVDPEKYVINGDKAKIEVGVGIKLKSGEKYEFDVFDRENNKIGKAVFREEGNKVVVDFDFNGTVYDGSREEVKVELAANFDLDTSSIPPNPSEDETIEILGKKYKLEKTTDNVIVKKTGVVNISDKNCVNCDENNYPGEPKNQSITWTVEVERRGAAGKPVPLAGYKFRDNLKDVGEYQTGSFMVDGITTNNFSYDKNSGEFSYTFPAGTSNKAVIKFSTRLTKREFQFGTTKANIAKIFDDKNKFAGSGKGIVEWNPNWGEKNAKYHKHNGRDVQFRKENGNYYIDWKIEFNKNGYELENVRIVDILKSGKYGTEVEFVQAILAKNTSKFGDPNWDNSWVPMKTFTTYPNDKETENPRYKNQPIFKVGNINFPIRLMITVKLKTNGNLPGSEEFENSAVVLWGSDWLIDFHNKVKVGEGGIITKYPSNDGVVGGWYPFEHRWNIKVDGTKLTTTNNTFAYDAMIFDPNVDLWQINHGYIDVVVKNENNQIVNLQSGIKVKDVVIEHSRFNKYLGEFRSETPGDLKHKTYKIYTKNGNKYIGDVLEVWNFKKQENRFSFKASLTTPLTILGKDKSNYNKTHLIQNGKEIDIADSWPSHRGRMLWKQALTADSAKKVLAGNLSANVVNENIYNENVPEAAKDPATEKKALNNKTSAYNEDDRSVIFRLSVNAAGIKNISEYIGPVDIKDTLPNTDWNFAKIGDKDYLLYEGESFGDISSREASVKAVGNPIQPPAGFTASIGGQEAKFIFNELNKPYVILIKVQLRDKNTLANQKGTFVNIARIKINDVRVYRPQDVDYDRGAINKEYDASNIDNGYLTWTIDYKPYKFHDPSKPVYLEDTLGEGLEIRRNKDKTLSFNNGNYKILEGHIDSDRKFVQDKELSVDEMKKILSYDENKRILKIEKFDKNKAYRFIYITDIVGKSHGERVENIVALKEGDSGVNIESPKDYIISKAYGQGTSKGFVGFTVRKVDEGGLKNLEGAEFEIKYPSGLKKTFKTGADGKIEFKDLRIGNEYELRETKAPAGYELDTTVYKIKLNELTTQGFEVVLVSGGPLVSVKDGVITVKNKKETIKKMDLTLIKADIADRPHVGQPDLNDIKHRLEGAEFSLRRKDGTGTTQTKTTNSNGEITFTGLTAGIYILKETKPPKGYKSGLQLDEYEIKVDPAKGEIEILEKQGHNFKLDNIKETDNKIVVYNILSSFTLVKADIKDKNANKLDDIVFRLKGAEFKLTKKNDSTKYQIAKTSDNGELTFTGLEAGEYILRELKAPDNYTKIMDDYEITFNPIAEIGKRVIIKNPKTGQIKQFGDTVVVFNKQTVKNLDIPLIKADLIDGKATNLAGITHRLDGAEFTLTNNADNKVIKSAAVPGKKGNLIFRGVNPGTYTLRETKAPAGYELLTKTYKVTVTPDTGNGPKVFIETLGDSRIKFIENTIVVFNEKLYDLELIKADVVEKNVDHVDDFKIKLQNAKFKLTSVSDATVSYSAVTNANGKLTFKRLRKGKYILKEEKEPNGYALLKSTYEITIDPDAEEGKKVTIKDINTNQIKKIGDTVVVFNEKLYNIELRKVDLIDKDVTELDKLTTPLDGAVFTLVKKVKAGEPTPLALTAETGKDVPTKGAILFKDIESGTYILKETRAPKGYASLIKEYEITVTTASIKPEVAIKAANPNQIKLIDNTIVVFNEKLIDIELYKADLVEKGKSLGDINSNLLLGGAKFKLTSVADASVFYEATTATEGAAKGKLTFRDLKKGTYILEEIEAPAGYAKLIKSHEITVTPSAVNPEVYIKDENAEKIKKYGNNTILVFNEKVLDIKLIKASLTDKDAVSKGGVKVPLNGAKFRLTLLNSDPVVSYSAVTEGNGELTFKNLKTGTYELKEEVAPGGYNILLRPHTIIVTASAIESKVEIKDANGNQIKKLEDGEIAVFNEKQEGSVDISLIKADLADKNANDEGEIRHPLAGAKFSLTLKSDQTVSKTAITNAQGKIVFNGMNIAGVYTLKEIEAPKGYTALMNEYEVTITPSAVSGERVAIKDADGNKIKKLANKDTILVFNEKNYDLKLLKADLDVNKDLVTKAGITLGAIKTPLNGARFRLALAANPAVSYSAVTGENGASEGSIIFKGLKSGVYTLTEEIAPAGYTPIIQKYEITVTASAVKSEFAIKNAKAGEIRELENTIVVFDKKIPTPPTPPTTPPGGNPPPPVVPLEPREPNNPPTPPTPPTPPAPNIPNYPADNPPDPDDPDSPDEFVSVDEDGTPQGRFKKTKKANGKNEYVKVNEDGTPKGVTPAKKLPKTGGSDTTVYYAAGAMLLLAAGIVVVRRKKYIGK